MFPAVPTTTSMSRYHRAMQVLSAPWMVDFSKGGISYGLHRSIKSASSQASSATLETRHTRHTKHTNYTGTPGTPGTRTRHTRHTWHKNETRHIYANKRTKYTRPINRAWYMWIKSGARHTRHELDTGTRTTQGTPWLTRVPSTPGTRTTRGASRPAGVPWTLGK